MYLDTTRLDIMNVVSILSMHCASENHFQAEKRIIWYVIGITDYGLMFRHHGYVDSHLAYGKDNMLLF